jgi:ankyrin repeat protein
MNLLLSRCDHSCVNRKNNGGQTALHIAAAGGRNKLAEALLKHGAKVGVRLHSTR